MDGTGPADRSRTGDDTPTLVFDVGGTTTRAGLFDPQTDGLTSVARCPTPSHRSLPDCSGAEIRRQLYAALERLAAEVLDGRPVSRVAVAFAGPVDPEGRVLAAPTVWGDREPSTPVSLKAELERLWPSARVWVLNDVSAAGLRLLRAPRESLCVITVSSGIGHKIFVEGQPVVGVHGRGGELGHLRVDFSDDAVLCDCGGRGHVGALASGRAARVRLERLARDDAAGFRASSLGARSGGSVSDVTNEMLAAAFVDGDPWVVQLIRPMATHVGRLVAAVHLMLGCERFVLVGGFAVALGEGYRQAVVATAAESAWDTGQDWDAMVELRGSRDDDGLIGAGRYAAMNRAQRATE